MFYVLSHKAKITTKVLLAAIMLFVGSSIYLLFRSKALYIYKWCTALGLSNFIDKSLSVVIYCVLFSFVKYIIPNEQYCAAYILAMDAIWQKECGWQKSVAIFSVPLFTICSEILQYYGIVKGTFDYCDLVCYAIPPTTYLYLKRNKITKAKLK